MSGAPGSGKTTLAQRLAIDLGLPLIAEDELKEVLYDTVGAPDRAASMRLGAATFALMRLLAGRLLNARTGLVLESNYQRGRSEPDLRPLVSRARAVLIHCQGDPQVIVRRYRERAERGERHPGHHDLLLVNTVSEAIASGVFEPLDLDVPTLRVDTTVGGATTSPRHRGYAPPYAQVLDFIRTAARVW